MPVVYLGVVIREKGPSSPNEIEEDMMFLE
jgi:hypothetical protein